MSEGSNIVSFIPPLIQIWKPAHNMGQPQIVPFQLVRACLNETLRLFPNVPMNERSTVQPTLIPSTPTPSNPDGKPIFVSGPDTPLRYGPMLMQRREDLWGKDALEWKPERWLDLESIKQITMDPFKFIPFNAGPRICLGQNFAYNEASFRECQLLYGVSSLDLADRRALAEWQFEYG